MPSIRSIRRAVSQNTMTIEPTDRRMTPRFRVQFRTFVFDQTSMSEHLGAILDLSLTGCRIEAPVPVQASAVMELRIYVPDLDWPLMVDGAVVQWVKGTTFGLRFLKTRLEEQDRLARVIARIAEDRENEDSYAGPEMA